MYIVRWNTWIYSFERWTWRSSIHIDIKLSPWRAGVEGWSLQHKITNPYSHQQNSKIVSGFHWFGQFSWFLETWKGNFLEKSQHFVRYRSGLGSAGLNDVRPCQQVSTKSSVARARLSSAPAQLCPKQRVWELGAELSCRNDGSNSGTAAQVTAS